MVLNNLENAKAERLKELHQPISHVDLLRELASTQEASTKLQKQMERRSLFMPAIDTGSYLDMKFISVGIDYKRDQDKIIHLLINY